MKLTRSVYTILLCFLHCCKWAYKTINIIDYVCYNMCLHFNQIHCNKLFFVFFLYTISLNDK